MHQKQRNATFISSKSIHSFHCSPTKVTAIKSRRSRWAGHVARREEGRRAFNILTGKPAGNRPLGRPRRRWEDNIRMNLKDIVLIKLRKGIIGELS